MILFKDDHLIVANKPAGLAVMPGGWEPGQSSLREQLEAEHGRLWVVHRLDRITSGVIVLARSAEVHRALNSLFETRAVDKIYHALTHGVPSWDERTARHPLRVNVGHSHRTAVDHRRGKPSATQLRVLRRFAEAALVEAHPETGRTHQVRVHLSALGFPLLADELYGAPPGRVIARPALHALSLAFAHPVGGEALVFEAPYPDDFAGALTALRATPKS